MTDNIQKLLKKILLAATALFMVASLATVIYYIIYPSAAYFHADCSDTIFWAQASFDGKTLFNPDFSYAAMLPFGGTMLMIPFIGIFGVSMTTHHIHCSRKRQIIRSWAKIAITFVAASRYA